MLVYQAMLDPRLLNAYAYASNNPISRYDFDGLMDAQAKRGAEPNQSVREFEFGVREELRNKCAQEARQNLDDCRKAANAAAADVQCDPKGGKAAMKKADEQRLQIMASFNCDKGSRCEYRACLAGASSGKNTTDYLMTRQRCMSQSQ